MSEIPEIPKKNIGDLVTWTDADLIPHIAKVTKVKRDNQLDLEYVGSDPKTIVTSGSHKSVQHPDYGCYWEELK